MRLPPSRACSPRSLIAACVAAALVLGATAGACAGGTVQESTQIIEDITASQAMDKITQAAADPDFAILDVRTPGEFAGGHIENAVNMDFYASDFRDQLADLDRSRTYVVYCRSGRRSEGARDMMKDLGFEEVYNVLGGILDWRAEGLPTVR